MIIPENKLLERFELFADTELLSEALYDWAHDEERIDLGAGDKYWVSVIGG